MSNWWCITPSAKRCARGLGGSARWASTGVWNGRDDVGESLASGRYVAKMVGADFVRQMAMTLLK